MTFRQTLRSAPTPYRFGKHRRANAFSPCPPLALLNSSTRAASLRSRRQAGSAQHQHRSRLITLTFHRKRDWEHSLLGRSGDSLSNSALGYCPKSNMNRNGGMKKPYRSKAYTQSHVRPARRSAGSRSSASKNPELIRSLSSARTCSR